MNYLKSVHWVQRWRRENQAAKMQSTNERRGYGTMTKYTQSITVAKNKNKPKNEIVVECEDEEVLNANRPDEVSMDDQIEDRVSARSKAKNGRRDQNEECQ